MDKRAALASLSAFREGIERRGVRVARLQLYGSFARGDFHEASDIDVVVISADFAGMDYWARIDLLSDVIYELLVPIEAMAMTPEEWDASSSPLVEAARDGEVVFAA